MSHIYFEIISSKFNSISIFFLNLHHSLYIYNLNFVLTQDYMLETTSPAYAIRRSANV